MQKSYCYKAKSVRSILVIFLLLLIGLAASAQAQPENNAPIVKILKPKTSESLKWNAVIPYAIAVNDLEDGASEYEEITNGEVLLIAKYLEDSSLASGYLSKIEADLTPLLIMSKSTCLNCHAASSKLIGPSFDLIAKKYRAKPDAKTYLAQKAATGGVGVWGEVKMPPNPDLNPKDLERIVDWILKQADDPTPFYVGLEGAIRTPKAPANSGKGVYALTAAYEDHGLAGVPENQKRGLQTIRLSVKR